MLDVTPTKLLIVLVFGLIILGPDKLPRVAKQVGEAWSGFKQFRQRMESEMRDVFPQLPSTTEIASAVRSPISLLDRLAATHEQSGDDGGVGSDEVRGAVTAASDGAGTDEAGDAAGIDGRAWGGKDIIGSTVTNGSGSGDVSASIDGFAHESHNAGPAGPLAPTGDDVSGAPGDFSMTAERAEPPVASDSDEWSVYSSAGARPDAPFIALDDPSFN
ncbi:MAG: twin-arginine translocase TatA/TatE family subunit [Acidimicrobiales bacterium]